MGDEGLARMIITAGIVLIFIGVILALIGLGLKLGVRCPWLPWRLWLGRLPGDIHIIKGRFHLYFPLVTCLIIGILISATLFLINLFMRK